MESERGALLMQSCNSNNYIHNVVMIFIICMNIVMEQLSPTVEWCGIHFCTVMWWDAVALMSSPGSLLGLPAGCYTLLYC